MNTLADRLSSLWQNPPPAFRGKPFWSWNGILDKDELLRQAGIFAEMGMGGFFMHSRTGLVTEYLGDEWFDLINACADEAKKLGLEAWLYDEDRWPSGSAGGLATQEAKYRMKVLRLTMYGPGTFAGHLSANAVAAFAACVEGINVSNVRRLACGKEADARPDESLLVFTTETMPEGSFYNGNTYLDTLRRDATEHFLAVTHELYRRRCGGRLGKSIKGIFTDEPHHGFVMCDHNDPQLSRDAKHTTPWTESLFDEFQTAYGYDLRDRLPELFLRLDGKRISPVKWQYMELIQRMFLENWAQPLQAWCRQHGLILTGHVLHEDTLSAQAVPCGSMMRYYEHMDYPGVDVLSLDNRNFWLVKQLASVARQQGKSWLLSELYGCTGWQMGFDGHKRIGDWQALLGINLRCHHLSWYTMAGEAKRDYPASISFQSGWYKEYSVVETYFARLGVLLQTGEPVCDVLVVNPVESTWAQVHVGWTKWLGSNDPAVDHLEARYAAVFGWLTGAQIDFDYGDEDHIARFARVESLEDGAVLRLVQGAYRVVLVAGMESIRASTLAVLKEFAAGGGRVIFAGDPPLFVNAVASTEASQIAGARYDVGWNGDSLTSAMRDASPAARVLRCDASEVLCQVRRDGARWIIVALNPDTDKSHPSVKFCFASNVPGLHVEEWDCLKGERHAVAAMRTAEGLEWHSDFPALAERAFVLTTQTGALPLRTKFVTAETRQIEGPFSYRLDEPNLLVLDFAEWQLGNGPWEPEAEILKIDETVRSRCGWEQRGGTMVQPWARRVEKKAEAIGMLRLRFAFDVAVAPSEPVRLFVEQAGSFVIRINGVAHMAAQDWLIDPCFQAVPIETGILKVGENLVELEAKFTSSLNLEAIYLAGEFGVTLTGRRATLGRLPEQLGVGDVTGQGLPFYSGKISYRLPVDRKAGETRAVMLALQPMGTAAVKLRAIHGGREQLLPWGPFEADLRHLADEADSAIWCDLYLTRRNTFGPLHQFPKEQVFYAPASFRTTGDEFREDYQLFPAGLGSAPELHFGTSE